MDKDLTNLSSAKKVLLEKWKSGQFTSQRIPKRSSLNPAPMSSSQQRLWFIDQYYHGSPFYNISGAIHLKGKLNVAALKQSLNEILKRHEAWRTCFVSVDKQPMQVIAPELTWELQTVNLEHLVSQNWEIEVQQIAHEEAKKPFDLTQAPLVRATLLQLNKEEHVFLLTMHHIVSDGWSLGVFVRELTILYAAFSQSKSSPLPPLPIQYADFAIWQRDRLQGESLKTQLNYWKQQLSGDLPVLQLPTDYLRPAQATFNGSKQYFRLSKTLTEAVKQHCQQEDVTLFMALLAAFSVLLYRYCGQEDILIGSPIANRNSVELEGMLGFFVNTLVLRNNLSNDPDWREFLKKVREVTLGAYAHQELPFEKLVEELQVERDLSRNPLFQVMFALQNAPLPVLEVADLSLRLLEIDSGTAMFDIFLSVVEGEQGLMGFVEYNTDLFDSTSMTRLISNFETLLENIVAHPHKRISEFSLLTPQEKEEILVEWNRTHLDYFQDNCIHDLFEAQVEKTPEAIAIVFEDEQLSYQELNCRVNQLAHYLQFLGVDPDTLVGIYMERSLDMIVGLLGVLKAGGAYVPLDPAYPKERLTFMLEDTQVPVLLTQKSLVTKLPEHKAHVLCLDDDKKLIHSQNQNNPSSYVKPTNLAYVLYTSGSTGKPKGVSIEHRNTVAFLNWAKTVYDSQQLAGVLASTSICFDLSVFEIFVPLCWGGKVILAENVLYLPNLRAACDVTLVNTVPSAIAELLRVNGIPEGVSTVNLAGEPLFNQLVQQLYNQKSIQKVFNLYGPSEATTYSTYTLVGKGANSSPSIGKPISNTQVYVLDKGLQPVPVGVPGELYIGGAGLARGYLNRSELTQEKFISNPFACEAESRLYKTGDQVRYLTNGEIQFLGRIDNQVKIRGFRIELGEIETVINQHHAVQQAVVIVGDHTQNNDQSPQGLVAYVVPNAQALINTDENNSYIEQVSDWEKVWYEIYTQSSSSPDPTFNTIGWNSSYTSQPIPLEEMRTWVNSTVERILENKPKRILEIGCGVGLLLFRLAPQCQKYWATDFSATAIYYLQKQLLKLETPLPQVTLFQKNAEDFEEIELENPDAIVVNSVVQYFPSINYLLRFLEKAVNVVQAGGFIFLGDIRNLLLLDAFHTSVELYRGSSNLTKAQLEQRLQKSRLQEKELFLNPAFFVALKQVLPKISHVQIQPKRGYHSQNELTKYRYDVTLHIGTAINYTAKVSWLDWQKQMLTLTSVHQILETTQPEFLGLTRVQNLRVQADIQAVQWLTNRQNAQTVDEFQSILALNNSAIDPEDFWALSQKLPYTVEISWIGSDSSGSYNVLFKRDKTTFVRFPGESAGLISWSSYANNPLQGKFTRNFIQELHNYLTENLADYMIPSALIPLDTIPLTPNGKIDRRALPSDNAILPRIQEIYVPPQDVWETVLIRIWEEVLNISPIGVTDDFFNLGGHSLLAVRLLAQINKQFGQNLPLSTIFQNPTVKSLAQTICQKVSANSPLVAIQASGSKTPFFCVHPAGGTIFAYLNLAKLLDEEQPFYAFEQGPHQNECDIFNMSVEETAAYYIQQMRIVQPKGPYIIGGWSYGGVVAFEMAQQLQRENEKIALLVVFDTILTQGSTQLAEDNAKYLVRMAEFAKIFFGIDWSISYHELQHLEPDDQFHLLMKKANIINDLEIQQHLRSYEIFKAHVKSMQNYVPQMYSNKITLFRSHEQVSLDMQPIASLTDDSSLGWAKYSRENINIIDIPGNHFSMFTEPYVQELAWHLKHCLDNIE